MEIKNLLDIKYCLEKVKPDEWIKELEAAIAKSHEALQPLTSEEQLQPDILNKCADTLTEAMQSATETMAKV